MPTSVKCEQILVSPDLEIFGINRGNLGKFEVFHRGGGGGCVVGSKFELFFNIFLLSKKVLCQYLSQNEAIPLIL